MKRFIAVLLSFLFLLSGCKKTPEPNLTVPWDDITTQTTQVEDITTEPEIEKELLAVSVPAVTERIDHENGTELFSFTSQHMQLILPNAVAADKIVLNFLNRVVSVGQTVKEGDLLVVLEAMKMENASLPKGCKMLFRLRQ